MKDEQGKLVQRLEKLQSISSYSEGGWSEPDALANSIVSISEIGAKVSRMSKELNDCDSEGEFSDKLHELREELGHLAYHIFDSRYLGTVARRFIADQS